MPLVFVIHSGGEKMSYINTIDINGVVYNLGSLTDGNHEVNLPQNLKNNDVFLLHHNSNLFRYFFQVQSFGNQQKNP